MLRGGTHGDVASTRRIDDNLSRVAVARREREHEAVLLPGVPRFELFIRHFRREDGTRRRRTLLRREIEKLAFTVTVGHHDRGLLEGQPPEGSDPRTRKRVRRRPKNLDSAQGAEHLDKLAEPSPDHPGVLFVVTPCSIVSKPPSLVARMTTLAASFNDE